MTSSSELPPKHTDAEPDGSTRPRLAVFATSDGALAGARSHAAALGLACHDRAEPSAQHCDIAVLFDGYYLALRPVTGEPDLVRGHPVGVAWTSIDTTSSSGRMLGQPILKAIGIRSRNDTPTVIDATAGLGEDGYLMSVFGARITFIERQPIIAAMLRQYITTLATHSGWLTGRMSLIEADAGVWLRENRPVKADVVYLDFMFPSGRKTAERKPMKVLRMLAGADDDSARVLEAALESHAPRVVVKRPLRAPAVPGPAPTHVIEGKSLRFDVYLRAARTEKASP